MSNVNRSTKAVLEIVSIESNADSISCSWWHCWCRKKKNDGGLIHLWLEGGRWWRWMASAAVVAEVAARIIRALYARTGNGKIAELGATEPCQVTLWPRRDSISFFPKWKEEKHEEEVNKEEHQFNLTVIHFITVRKLTQNWRQIQSFTNCNGNSSLFFWFWFYQCKIHGDDGFVPLPKLMGGSLEISVADTKKMP